MRNMEGETKLQEYRVAAGLNQRQLAKLAVVARASISHIENCLYAPSPRFAGKICSALSEVLDRRLDTWDVFPEHFSDPDEPEREAE
jgi:DNA-binding XRE family transcriptional regulator